MMQSNTRIDWRIETFDSISSKEIYAILSLRQEVFIVEQHSIYRDIDGKDTEALHLMGWRDGNLVTYARILPPQTSSSDQLTIERVVVTSAWRGMGIGKSIMHQALDFATDKYPGQPIKLAAQLHLQSFYSSMGFVSINEPYDDAGVAHIMMVKQPSSTES